MIDGKTIFIGVAAGITAALLAASAATQTALAGMLMFASSLPLLIASLGWGWTTGAIAAVAACLALMLGGDAAYAIAIACGLFAPAAFVGYLANLARDLDGDGKLDWFPSSEILFRLALSVAVGFVALGLLVGYSGDLITPVIREGISGLSAQMPELQEMFTPARIDDMVRMYVLMFPASAVGFWALILINNLLLAASIARSSGQFDRPRDNLARDLTLPQSAAILYAASGIALYVLAAEPSGLTDLASAVFGAMLVAFAMVGLSNVHYYTQGVAARPLILIIVYGAIFLMLFIIPLFFLSLLGVAETFGSFKAKRAAANGDIH